MPLDAIFLEFTLFLGLVTLLASLPTDTYFHPWHDGPPYHRVAHDYRRPPLPGSGDPRIGPGASAHGARSFGGGFGEPGPLPREGWCPFDRGSPRGGGRDFPRRHRDPEGGFHASHRRNSDSVLGDAYPGVQNIGNSYSSHVNYEAGNQNVEAAKAAKNFRENAEPIFGSSIPGKIDGSERTDSEEGSRNLRAGSPKESDVPNPRIVTPKGRRRPPQGSSVKNQNKPFGPEAADPISSTEKAFRNQTAKGAKKPNAKPQGGDIVFPDGYPKKFVPRVTKCAKRSTFCEQVGEDYPSDYISQVLKKEGATFREFFGKDAIIDPDITERINAPEENSLCPYRQEVVFPRAAQNKEDKWLFIVNQDQYVQGVTVEVCLNPESRCILTEGFPLGYTPYCKQKYIERRLVAIGEDGKPHSDSFRLPSCCSCVVKHETSARRGSLRTSREAPHLRSRHFGPFLPVEKP